MTAKDNRCCAIGTIGQASFCSRPSLTTQQIKMPRKTRGISRKRRYDHCPLASSEAPFDTLSKSNKSEKRSVLESGFRTPLEELPGIR